MTTDRNRDERYRAGFAENANAANSLPLLHVPLGQNCPQHYPPSKDALGDPLAICGVARMLGCSAWTVRQKLLPRGLPHFRSGPNGKLVFFRDQVVAWILSQQKKGGKP